MLVMLISTNLDYRMCNVNQPGNRVLRPLRRSQQAAGLAQEAFTVAWPDLARTRKAMENFEARGKEQQAAQCRAKVQKIERRIDAKTLVIIPAANAGIK